MRTILTVLIIVFLVLAVWAYHLWVVSFDYKNYKYQKIFAYIEYACVLAAFITAMVGTAVLRGGI